MKASRDAIQKFVTELEGYSACLKPLIATPPKDTAAEILLAWQAQADAAIDNAIALKDDFSVQLKAFKARSAK